MVSLVPENLPPLARILAIDIILDNPNVFITWFKVLCDKIVMVEKNIPNDNVREIFFYLGEKYIFSFDTIEDQFYYSNDYYYPLFTTEFNIDNYYIVEGITQVLAETILSESFSIDIKIHKTMMLILNKS